MSITINLIRYICLSSLLGICLICCKHGSISDVTEIPLAYQGYEIDTTIVKIANLPDVINESSGIILWDSLLWLHNDSKKEAALYGLAANGTLHRTVEITDKENIDWEDIAQDDKYVYIGDFGNNHGNRKDLSIYIIDKDDIRASDQVVSVGTIQYAYPDQEDFSGPKHGHNYDCEGMIVVRDSLYLFSKNFEDKRSRLYALPKIAGTYKADLKDEFDVKGNITGADIDPISGKVVLSGYYFHKGTFLPFVWKFWDYPGQQFFQGQSKRVNLSFQSQIEGVSYRPVEEDWIICAESTLMTNGSLIRMD